MRCGRKECGAQCCFDRKANEFWCDLCGWTYKMHDDKVLEEWFPK